MFHLAVMITQVWYVVPISVLWIFSVSGSAITTLSCEENGEEGKAHTITCDIQGNIANGITFTRPDDFAVVQCTTLGVCIPDDSVYAVSNSGNKYQLHIQNLRKKDAGDWKCRDGANGVMEMGCNLIISSPVSSAITTLSCEEHGEEGKAHTIACDIQGNIANGITFTRPDNFAVVQCTAFGVCIPDDNVYNVSNSGNKYQLHIQNLRKKDAGDWKCRDGANGVMEMGCNLTISSPVNAPVTSGVGHKTEIVSKTLVYVMISWFGWALGI